MRLHSFAIAALLLSVAPIAMAQERQAPPRQRDAAQRQDRTALRVPPEGTQEAGLDQSIAACLILGNQEELAVAQFAQQRAQSPEVKQFAQQMIKEHQQAISQLEKFAPQGVSLKLDSQAAGAHTRHQPGARTPEGETRAPAGEATPHTEGDMHQQMLAVQKDVTQQRLALTQRELSEKEGAKFDQCFIGQQTGAHIGMLAMLTGAAPHVSSELRSVLEQQQPGAEQHLQQAKQLMEQLDSQAQTARRTEAAPRTQ